MLSIILLFSGITKIIDPALLIENLSSVFPSVSETIVISISSLLPLVEIGLGVFLMVYGVKGSRGIGNKGVGSRGIGNKGIRAALISTVVLFGIFFLYSVYGFILGNQSDCGCFGNVVKSSFGLGMITRNFVFFVSSVLLLLINKQKNNISS